MIMYKSYDKIYDHNFINICISIFRLMKDRRKIWTSSSDEFNVSSNIFSSLEIFFRSQISCQFIKQTIIWYAAVFFKFETLEIGIFKRNTQTAFHHFYNSDSSVHFPLQNIQNKKRLPQK